MNLLSRRSAVLGSLAGLAAMSSLAARAATDPARKRACILLWMAGGPSQMDTFDLKPGTAHGGPFREIATSAPGVRFSEHLPELAKQAGHLAIVRSLATKEGDHGRATAHLRTGYTPQGSIRFPSLGSLVSHERLDPAADLPGFVSVGPQGAFAQPSVAAGFLGPQHAPLIVGGNDRGSLVVEDLQPRGVTVARRDERLAMLRMSSPPSSPAAPGRARRATSPPTIGPSGSGGRRRSTPST